MGNITNKDLYPNETTVNKNDFVIGSDQNGITKTFQLDDLQSLLDSTGYTRAQMLTLIGNSALKLNVEYKIVDAGSNDDTIVVKASSSSELFRMCYNLNDTSDLYQYNISTDSLLVFSPSALGDMTKAVYDQANIAQQVVGTTATQTLTNKTLEDYSNHIHADVLHVRAKATENISKGQAVVITGYNVGEAAEEVALANNTTGVASGIAYEDITTGNFGLIVTAGILENVDTSAFSEGVILYVNGSGNLTPTEPSTGFAQPIAYVLRSNANTGALQILASYPKQDAADVRYSNGVSGLTATDVQAAIDEVKELVSGGGYTDEQAQDAVGLILTDSTEIDFTYDDAKPSIMAALKASSIDETKLDASVNASLDKADSALQSSDIGVTVQAYSAVLAATTASFTTADETKLDGIEANADVTDTDNVRSAGALMDDEVTNLADVKAFDPANYATAAQGALADSALQPTDIDTLAELNALLTDATLIDTNDSRLSDARTPLAHTHTHADITDYDTELAGKTNTNAFTPTADYHPATKKYVDDAIVIGGGYTDAQAQDAVGAILTDTAEIDFNYDAILRLITASLKAGSIDETKLDASVNASLDLADTALQPSEIGVTVQAHSAVLDATTASFTTADESKLDGIEANADVTDATNVNAAGAVMNSDYNQSHSVLVQQNSSGSPEIVNFNNNSILGKGGGDIAALTPAEVRSIINVEDNADVTDTNNVRSAGALMDDEVTNLADVKAFDPANYATAAQGTKADSALQDLVDDTTPQLGGDLDLNGNKILALPCEIGIACSDETTALTTGTAKATFRMPYAMTLTAVRASLTGAGSTSGTTTIDINESGTTVLSTKLTIDAGEKTSTTAATPAVISDSALADDAEITIDIDAVSGGADETGLKVWLIGTRS